MTIVWKEWNDKLIKDIHGNVFFHRKLYEGDHHELFPRAVELIEKGEIVGNISDMLNGEPLKGNVRTPYIIANVSKLIPEIPAMLISRSMGKIKSSIVSSDDQNESVNEETDELVDEGHGAINENFDNVQDEIIKQITKNSNMNFEHYANILQHQIDGGIVGVPRMDENGVKIEFKKRDLYFPHEDGLGCDLAYQRMLAGDSYLHVYRERVNAGSLETTHFLYTLKGGQLNPVEDGAAKALLEMDSLSNIYKKRSRPFVMYWANEKTFSNPLGKSSLQGQHSKQDEINWVLTNVGITFTRNSKPRIQISKEIFETLIDKAEERYGEGGGPIDHRDLEITTFDDNGRAMEVLQIDTTKIGDITWVKDLMKLMFVETKTSEKAVDFYMESGASGAQSGIAKFYDLFISIVKAEQLQNEYIYFLQQLYEGCLWMVNDKDSKVIIEEPEITLNSMIPISRKELMEENNAAFTALTQSLETTVRRNNPHASEEWIEEEIVRLEEAKLSSNSISVEYGRQTLENMTDNQEEEPVKVEDET